MLRFLIVLTAICLVSPCFGQDDFFGSPPSKQDKQQPATQLIDGNQPNVGILDGTRLTEILNSLQQARNERKEMSETIAELQKQQTGLLDTLRELRENLKQQREDNNSLRESLTEWRKEHEGIVKNLGDFLKESRESRAATRAEWLEHLRQMRDERREDFKQWWEEVSKSYGPIRSGIQLLTNLVWSLIIFIGITALAYVGFRFFTK